MTGGRRLALFVREPTPGAVKTRLGPALGLEGAARLYRGFLEDLSARLAGRGEWEAVAVHDGPEPGPVLAKLFGGAWRLSPQGPGSLGERLARCFRKLAGPGVGATVVAGSDVPSLSGAAVEGAFQALEGSGEVVFSPSPDGGFALVGIPWKASPAFLEGRIGWSTASALADAVREAMAARHPVRYLPDLPDVDEPGDLAGLEEYLSRNPLAAPATSRALADVARARAGERR